MANLTFDGKRLQFPGGGILDFIPPAPTPFQLFTFDTNGTTLNNLQVGGTSLGTENTPEWDFGDTTTDDTINTNFTHTYTGGYVSPTVKTVTFSLLSPNDATNLNLYGTNPSSKNNITSVDLTDFTSLEVLNIGSTDITSIDLSNNPNLTSLTIPYTNITSLDITNNTNLTSLSASNNSISSIDVSNNTSLTSIQLNGTDITSIDLSNNTALTSLQMYDTDLSSIDLSNNTLLSTLFVYLTNITSLDLTKNTNINQINASLSSISTVLFDTGATYASFSSINISNNNMTSTEVDDFIDHMWDMRNNFTSGFKGIAMDGSNADLSFESTHKVLFLQKDHNFSSFTSSYNIPDNIMQFGWSGTGNNTNITNYFLSQSEYSPQKGTIYGNSISSVSDTIGLTWDIYVDTNLTDFQSSNVQWLVAVRYRKHFTDSWTTADSTTYTLTGNTSGFELQKTVSVSSITGINGTDNFGIQTQVTLTDNRADKTQDSGDYMILRVVPSISSSITSGIVPYPNDEVTLNFTRTKWGA